MFNIKKRGAILFGFVFLMLLFLILVNSLGTVDSKKDVVLSTGITPGGLKVGVNSTKTNTTIPPKTNTSVPPKTNTTIPPKTNTTNSSNPPKTNVTNSTGTNNNSSATNTSTNNPPTSGTTSSGAGGSSGGGSSGGGSSGGGGYYVPKNLNLTSQNKNQSTIVVTNSMNNSINIDNESLDDEKLIEKEENPSTLSKLTGQSIMLFSLKGNRIAYEILFLLVLIGVFMIFYYKKKNK